MPTKTKYDYIIVGAGASGLMLAYKMAIDRFFDDKSILIIDKEKKSQNDRTWCFWEEENGKWDEIVKISWKQIIFKNDTIDKQESINPYQYKMIRSSDFYSKIWKILDLKTNFTFYKDQVSNIFQEIENAKVVTLNHTFYSKNVINSILFSDDYTKQNKYPVLQQHFVGFFIKTKEDTFDKNVATFMDFAIPQKGNTRFMYVLPSSKNEALFEYTLFSSELLSFTEYKIAIENYLKDKGVSEYKIVEKEQGSIPMTCYEFWNVNSKNRINIGTAGGWSKASTGFTFKNTMKKTTELMNHLKSKRELDLFHKKTRFWFYDLLLLDILHEKNHLGATIFGYMFKNNHPKNILKFLDEETTLVEDLQIQLRMPPYEFVRALLKRLFR